MFLKIYSKLSSSLIWRLRTIFLLLLSNKKKRGKVASKSVLIYRLDGIGDYILFRNYLQTIMNSSKYEEYSFEYLGSSEVKTILECYDKDLFKKIHLIDKRRLYCDFFYHIRILLQLRKLKQEIIINPLLTHEDEYNDYIIQYLEGERISFRADKTCSSSFAEEKIFSQLIESDSDVKFEFYRNKEFCDKLLEIDTPIPALNLGKEYEKGNYITIFPGAQDAFRCWSKESFLNLINRIIKDYNYRVIILGGKNEIEEGEFLRSSAIDANRISNLCGKTSIPELINRIGESKLLISNETVAIHIAAATRTKAICISNGNHYGRFNPYHSELAEIVTVYPPQINDMSEKKRISKYRYGSDEEINTINSNLVFSKFRELIDSIS